MSDMESLEKALVATIPGFRNVYLVLDAIDECPQDASEREILLGLIRRIQEWSLDNLHVLLTSRKEQGIDDALQPLFKIPTFNRIDLERRREEVDRDIGAFIDQAISLKSWPPKIKQEVKRVLLKGADGCEYGETLFLSLGLTL